MMAVSVVPRPKCSGFLKSSHVPQASDFRVAQICGNRYVIHLGRWSRVQKRYQGGWGGGPQLQLPCPMPPSAVAAGPVKKNGSDSDFLAVQRSATADRGLGQGKCSWGGLAQPPRSPLQAPDRPSKRTACRSRQIGASPTPPLQRPQKTLRSHS